MPSPPDSPATFERQAPVSRLPELGVALARALGESGLGGTDIHSLMAEAVRAECIACGMRLSGADLAEAAVGSAVAGASSKKVERLRLGYCARNACASNYYLLRFTERPGVDWDRIWHRLEEGGPAPESVVPEPETSTLPPAPPVSRVARQTRALWARYPIQITVCLTLAGFLWVRSGCRVPGISPKPRVFIVTSDPSSGQPAATPGTAVPAPAGR